LWFSAEHRRGRGQSYHTAHPLSLLSHCASPHCNFAREGMVVVVVMVMVMVVVLVMVRVSVQEGVNI
jgi:hypothetical protein